MNAASISTWTWLTPAGPAALALVRVQAGALLLARLIDRSLPEPGTARVVHLRDQQGVPVDEVVVMRVAPECLEIAVHGGAGVRAGVSACLTGHGLAGAGSLPSGSGAIGAPTTLWQALAQAPSPAAVSWLLGHPMQAPAFCGDYLRRCPVVLISGPANAGKSTLLNAWCGHRRALVSAVAGTTRDLVAAEALVGGWRLRLLDSAGLRPAGDALEREGQRLAEAARTWADVVVSLVPPDGGGLERPGDIVVPGKCDLRADAPAGLAWSAQGLPGRPVADLIAGLGAAVLARLSLPAQD